MLCQAKADLSHKPWGTSTQIDVINDDIKPVVETIMDKGTAMQGTYKKARVAKRAVGYGALCTDRHFTQIWSDCPLKDGTVRGWENRCNREVSTAVDHASLQTRYPHTTYSTSKDSAIPGSVQYNH